MEMRLRRRRRVGVGVRDTGRLGTVVHHRVTEDAEVHRWSDSAQFSDRLFLDARRACMGVPELFPLKRMAGMSGAFGGSSRGYARSACIRAIEHNFLALTANESLTILDSHLGCYFRSPLR